ncbi:hypothetical protein DFQ27_008676 [Actinomortierella ambigua]|uniref:JmjC domain-containing protein n=1 Tax=Actinomortierella ambigua TaxID=1343610 RepID=A0A9P6UBG6_9FUNG|nr:hypothetical protein DFQ27_008676 [Actinomortierella ambigua]
MPSTPATVAATAGGGPPAKRQRIIVRHEKSSMTTQHVMSLQHPLGIKPMGNYFMDATQPGFKGSCRGPSLGNLARLTDEVLLELLGHLTPQELLTLGECSRVLYAFTHLEELWRPLTLERFKGDWVWQEDSWRLTYLKRADANYDTSTMPANRARFRLTHFYSDTLFQPFKCAAIGMDPYIAVENIDRRTGLTVDQFIDEYERPGKPVILADGCRHWPGLQIWNETNFLERWPQAVLRAESVDMTLEHYFRYAHNTKDESPLYLFDKNFGERCPGILDEMEVPPYFREDFFKLLGDQRPDFRWLIVGPARSGSTFHKDPNATSAWNAVITGSKKWIMFPPHILPPGVFTNEDESEVTSPVSLMEWFSNFYQQTQLPDDPSLRPLEGICRPGEIMFVPRGWWHAVVNLEDCIAVTQNYVGSQNLRETMEFLYYKRDQVSGVPDHRREGLFEEWKEAFYTQLSNTSQQDKKDEGEKVEEKSNANNEKNEKLLALWAKYEEDIVRQAKIRAHTKRCAADTTHPEKQRELSFWERAKMGTSSSSSTAAAASGDASQESEMTLTTAVVQDGEAPSGTGSSSGGFSFGFAFDPEDDEEGEEEEPAN